MAASLTLAQPYPMPGVVNVTFGAAPIGDYVRAWVTSAPVGSNYRTLLDEQTFTNRAVVFDGGVSETWEADLNAGGQYSFTLQEYDLIETGYGGGYQRDPNSNPRESKQGSELSDVIYVGDRLTHRLGATEYGFADLVLWVWDDTIQRTTKQVHGETTPAILDPTSPRAEVAAYSSTVAATVETLVGSTASSLLTNVAAMVNDLKTKIPLHMGNATYHSAIDDDNDTEIESIPNDPSTPFGYANAARILAQRLGKHMSDEDVQWHTSRDYENALVARIPASTSDMPAIWAAIADVYRAYDAHRSFSGHPVLDTTNFTTATLDKLLTLHRDFLAELQVFATTAPTVANSAATQLLHWGFGRAPQVTRPLLKLRRS